MNYFNLNLSARPRHFPCRLPVRMLGYVPRRAAWNDWRNAVRRDVDISFIVRGRGSARVGAQSWRVQAPCAIVKPPTLPIRYGPDPGTTWDEFYVDYGQAYLPMVQRLGLLHGPPVRPLAHPAQISHLLLWLDEARALADAVGGADRIDRLCDLLLMETALAPRRTPPANTRQTAIEALRAYLECHAGEGVRLDRAAREHGLAPATFRRLWKRRYPDCPPARFMMRTRMDAARRLLAETALPIKSVAARLGFSDVCYFMHVFRRHTGRTAAAYRAVQQRRARTVHLLRGRGRPKRG